MRTRNVLAFAVAFALASAALAQTVKAPIAMPAADLKWTDLDPATAPGVKITDVWGDHTKGGFGSFIKFPAGFAAPLHRHTNDFRIVVVSGTFILGSEGKPEVRLGPGSFLMQPGANYWHTTTCDPASECLFFVQSQGMFDFLPKETAKAPATSEYNGKTYYFCNAGCKTSIAFGICSLRS